MRTCHYSIERIVLYCSVNGTLVKEVCRVKCVIIEVWYLRLFCFTL